MDDISLIIEAQKYIKKIFNENIDGHDFNHSIRVYYTAMMIADTIPESDTLVVALAALLHDVDDHKLFNTDNNANARLFLVAHNVDSSIIEQICNIINSVSFSQNKGLVPTTTEGKIVQDADRLDAIGAIGISRTFVFSGAHGKPMKASIQHFYDKLLLLKSSMNTDEGKRLADLRHVFMEEFLMELQRETNGLI